MSYLDDQWRNPPPPPPTNWRREWPTIASALAAVVICGLSGSYLVHRWEAAAPYRAEVKQRALEREAERERQLSETLIDPVPDAGEAISDVGSMSEEQRERLIAQIVASGMSREEAEAVIQRMEAGPSAAEMNTDRTVESRTSSADEPLLPAEWISEPRLTVLPGDVDPGIARSSVRVRCNVALDGRMSDCAVRETPAGSGLGRAAQRAIDRTPPRLQPLRTVNGRNVPGTYEFGWTYTQSTPRLGVAPRADPPATDQPPASPPVPDIRALLTAESAPRPQDTHDDVRTPSPPSAAQGDASRPEAPAGE